MAFDEISGMLEEQELERYVQSKADLPLIDIFKPEVSEWSNDHASVLNKISGAKNGDRFFKTVAGFPEKANFNNMRQCEAQIVEYVRFYGKLVNLSESDIKQISIDLIQASPLSDIKPATWNDNETARQRVAEIYDFIIDSEESDTSNDDSSESKPQDLSNVDIPNFKRSSQRQKNIRKDLLGK